MREKAVEFTVFASFLICVTPVSAVENHTFIASVGNARPHELRASLSLVDCKPVGLRYQNGLS